MRPRAPTVSNYVRPTRKGSALNINPQHFCGFFAHFLVVTLVHFAPTGRPMGFFPECGDSLFDLPALLESLVLAPVVDVRRREIAWASSGQRCRRWERGGQGARIRSR
jgi:hypothetical protein